MKAVLNYGLFANIFVLKKRKQEEKGKNNVTQQSQLKDN
jgi:hypothetical protein